MIRVGNRHLGRARKYRRKKKSRKQEMSSAEPQHWEPCNICGGMFVFAKLPENEYMGKKYCAWCAGRDAKKQIQYMVLVEKLAKVPCFQLLRQQPMQDQPRVLAVEEGCKCLSCIARRIARRDIKSS